MPQARASRSSSPISASPMPRRRARRCTSIFATSARCGWFGGWSRSSCTVPTIRPSASATSSRRSSPATPRRRRARRPAPAPRQRPHEADRSPAFHAVQQYLGQFVQARQDLLASQAANRRFGHRGQAPMQGRISNILDSDYHGREKSARATHGYRRTDCPTPSRPAQGARADPRPTGRTLRGEQGDDLAHRAQPKQPHRQRPRPSRRRPGVALSELLGDAQAPAEPLCRRAQQEVWEDPASGYRRRQVGALDPRSGLRDGGSGDPGERPPRLSPLGRPALPAAPVAGRGCAAGWITASSRSTCNAATAWTSASTAR